MRGRLAKRLQQPQTTCYHSQNPLPLHPLVAACVDSLPDLDGERVVGRGEKEEGGDFQGIYMCSSVLGDDDRYGREQTATAGAVAWSQCEPLCLIPLYAPAASKNPDSVFIEVICYGFTRNTSAKCTRCWGAGGQ